MSTRIARVFHPSGSSRATSHTVRRATSSDRAALEHIEQTCFSGDRLSARSLRTLIARPSASVLVAERNAEVVASVVILYRRTASVGRLYSLAVVPAARGLGLAGLLLKAAEDDAASRGQSALRLEVRADNASAIALYEAAGYRLCGRRADFYEDGETALLFKKTLGPQKVAARVGRGSAVTR